MLHWVWVLIVGALIGIIASWLTRRGGSMNWIVNIIAGLVGSAFGEAILGDWGPQLADMALIPSILGAAILVLLCSWLFGWFKQDPAS